jgi:minor capsid protein 2
MPTSQPKAAIAAIEDPLLKVYADAWEQIVESQRQIAADPLKWRQKKRLLELQRAIENKMAEIDAAAREWVQTQLVRPYAMGAAAGAAELQQSAAAVWTLLPQDAISRMATDTLGDLLKSTRFVRRTTKALIRAIGRDQVLAKLTQGQTAVQAGRRMAQILEQRGIHAIRYADGSRHGLKEYSQMLLRTKTGEAYNLGSLEAQEVLGVEFWECFDGAGCGLTSHQDPVKALGRILDKDTALRYPLSHPNCRRSFGARPDIMSKAHADAASSHVTASQIADNAAADQERTRAQEARRYRRRSLAAPLPVSRRGTRRAPAGESLTAARRGNTRVPTKRRGRG